MSIPGQGGITRFARPGTATAAQLSFLNLVAGRAGHTLDFDRLNPSTFMRAMIASFHGDAAPLSSEIAALGR